MLGHLLRGGDPEAPDPTQCEFRAVNPTSPFSLAVMAIVALSLLGLPIGHAMIGGSILYLFVAGLDLGPSPSRC